MLLGKIQRGARLGCDLALPCFPLMRFFKGKKPQDVADGLAEALEAETKESKLIAKATSAKGYVMVELAQAFMLRIIQSAAEGTLLAPEAKTKDKVMIEYSQPNTHKAFHVGHMRNAALGDCLVRLHEFCGYPVVAANYLGDEGAHIAKCLWKVKKHVAENKFDIDNVPEAERAEWLGEMYSAAVQDLALSALTDLPFAGVVAARVESIAEHKDPSAPWNWHVVTLRSGPNETDTNTVVCGGRGYKVGDYVAYMPLGGVLKNNKVVPKDMKGVESCGVMLAYAELDKPEPRDTPAERKAAEEQATKAMAEAAKNAPEGKAPAPSGKKSKKKKKGKKSKIRLPGKIFIVDTKYKPTPGAALAELGRLPSANGIPDVVAEIETRKTQVGQTLRAMEDGDEAAVALWKKTKQWSLNEFKKIYQWLNCRFDHDFFESDVSESSRKLVQDLYDKKVLQKFNGAIVADLTKDKLGYLVLLKSNGAGLYATKDLQLAQIKFEKFKIDRSLYVVDASQSLHFRQVFKVLSKMGYKQAEKCYHIAYGMVVLPHGKMSSRAGTVILFSALQKMLREHLDKEYLQKFEGKWPAAEVDAARRALAVGTIKYGMLNHDVTKDVVFEMGKWSAKTGETGPYNMYAYTRSFAIKGKVDAGEAKCAVGNLSPEFISSKVEREVTLHIARFWETVDDTLERKSPNLLCNYVFKLSKLFNSWYETTNVIRSEQPDQLATRLAFSQAIGGTIKTCLNLLGIDVLNRM